MGNPGYTLLQPSTRISVERMLVDTYKKEGIPLGTIFGVAYPEYFVHPVAEYLALTRFAGVIDLCHWKILRVGGNDRVSFLNAMITCDVAALQPGRGAHAVITTLKGKFIGEMFVFAREADFLIFVAQGNGDETREVLEKHIITEDVTITDLTSSHGVVAVEGPKAFDVVWRMLPGGPVPKDRFRAAEREFEDWKVYLMNNTVAGDTGYHLMIPADRVLRARNLLVQAALGSDGLPVGKLAWNMRRVENGLPWHGADVTSDNFPNEARLEQTINYDKGCFLGQEPLARLKHRGHVNRLLVALTLEGDPPFEDVRQMSFEDGDDLNIYDEAGLRRKAEPVASALDLSGLFPPRTPLHPPDAGDAAAQEKPIGWITSAVYSPVLGKPLFLGYVRVEFAEGGRCVLAAAPSGKRPLIVVDLPVSA
jgi:folate-binding protein YgfZ